MMKRNSRMTQLHLLRGLLVAAGVLWSWMAFAQNCPGVDWAAGPAGERIYTCQSAFSTSRTPGGQSTWDDGARIQDALTHTPIPGCDTTGNGTRVVTILPGPAGSHRGACVVRSPI